MCTGLEILSAVGAGLSAGSALGLIGGDDKPAAVAAPPAAAPAVVNESPVLDQAKIDAEARTKAAQDAAARKRRMRGSSLLASGGDTSSPLTGQPMGKATLGA